MERLVQVERERLMKEMRQELEQTLGKVMDAVNRAKDGRLIEDSELPVLTLMQEFQARVFEKALQLRVDQTEASFSPSVGSGRSAQAKEGSRIDIVANATGSREPVASAVRRGRGSCRPIDQ